MRFFLLFLLDDRRIWTRTSDKWIRIQEAQKHMETDGQSAKSDLTCLTELHKNSEDSKRRKAPRFPNEMCEIRGFSPDPIFWRVSLFL
jgi:hypothetical protein